MSLAIQEEVAGKVDNKLGVFFKKIFDNLVKGLSEEEIEANVIGFMSLPNEMARAEFILDDAISNRRLVALLKACLAEIESLENIDFCQAGAEGCLEYKWGESTLLILFTNASSSNRKIYFNCYLH